MAACGYVESCVLYYLEFGDIGGGRVREIDWGGVSKKGVYEGIIGCDDGPFLFAPRRASEGFQERASFWLL